MMNPNWTEAAICEAFMQDMIDSIWLQRRVDIDDQMYAPWGGQFSDKQPILFVQDVGTC